MGPCLTRLKKCDEYYEASPLPPYTESVTTDDTVAVADGEKCEMATCLAQVAPQANAADSAYQDADASAAKPITGRVANAAAQPDQVDNKGVDQVATVCTKDFMKSHKTKFDLALMQCVQLRATTAVKQPYHQTTTTTPGPTPANWFCVPRFNFDIHVNDGQPVKEVIGPFRTINAAKDELAKVDTTMDANGRKRRIEQFICEIRDEAQYNNELPPGHPAAKFPVQRGKVQKGPQNPFILGNVATRSGEPYNQYTKWQADGTIQSWGITQQYALGAGTSDGDFNAGCHNTLAGMNAGKAADASDRVTPDQLGTSDWPNQGVNQCPDRVEMLDYCQHEIHCNPYNPADLIFLDPEPTTGGR